MESRFVKTRRKKPENPLETEIKCRWCVKGFRDPDLLEVERQSPTLSMDALMMILQVIASNGWKLIISDVEGAFLQGENLVRKNGKIYVKLPADKIPGCDGSEVVELVKCVYGLVDAPRHWWKCFSGTLKELGMRQSELDPCTFHWYYEGVLAGVVALHVDDMVIGGSDMFHEKVLLKLRDKYPFKHWKVGGGSFLGRELKQLDDGTIVCGQKEYAQKVETIRISKDRRKEKDSEVTEKERRQLRGVIGAANWLMGSTRPDIAVLSGWLQQRVQRAKVQDLIEANKLVSKIRDLAHVQLKIQKISLDKGVILVATDASWGNNEDLKSQAGYVVCFGDQQLKQGKEGLVNPLRWKS